jgi:hypothetical protein
MAATITGRTERTRIVLLGQDLTLPSDFSGRFEKFAVALPDAAERRAEMKAWFSPLKDQIPSLVLPSADDPIWLDLVRASATLSLRQVSNQVKVSAALHKQIGRETVDLFNEQKVKNLLQTGITIVPPPRETLGGFDVLLEWLNRRTTFFNTGDPDIPNPKGFLAVGYPGTGKSLLAKMTGQMFKCPVFKLEPDLLLGGLVGESEQKTKHFLRAIAAAAPGVLWIDEIEKMFSGMASGYSGDGGVGARVFGQILTFLQENAAPIFVVATANSVDGLPSELLRKGRFDEIFWIDLPTQAARREILDIHLRRWATNLTPKQISEMADLIALATDGWVGSELAEIVREAAMDAIAEGRKGTITLQNLQTHRSAMTPLSQTEEAKFKALRQRTSLFRNAATPAEETANRIDLGRGSIVRRRIDK